VGCYEGGEDTGLLMDAVKAVIQCFDIGTGEKKFSTKKDNLDQ
jgi:hypothetical protein